MNTRLSASAALCLSFCALTAQAQNVFVLPGANSTNSTVVPFSDQFVPVGSGFTAGAGAFQIFSNSAGTAFYVVSSSSSQPITSVAPGFQTPAALGNFGAAVTKAAITPDGKDLIVLAGGALHIFSTATNTDQIPAGITPGGGSIIDFALSLDGSRVFALATTTTTQGTAQATVSAISPSNNSTLGSLVLTNIVTNISVGPNDLVYVGGTNRLYEINPNTVALTANGDIPLIANAGPPGFTPDGVYAVVPNQSSGQNTSSVLLVDLTKHAVVTTGPSLSNSVIDRVLVPSNTLAFAYSTSTQSVYQFTLPNLNVSSINFPGVQALNVTSAALSNEVAGGSNATPGGSGPATANFLYLIQGDTLYRVDLTTGQLSGQFPVPSNPAPVITTAGPALTGSPSTLLQYGSSQQVAPGATSLPLVLRTLDSNGNPLSGVPVSFAISSGGGTIQSASATTGSNGYALTTFTAPTTGSLVVVTATAGDLTATFNITVGSGSTGGGSGSAGGLIISDGQGQVFLAGFGSTTFNGKALTVEAVDASGKKPVPGVTVTFEPVASSGTPAGTLLVGMTGVDAGPTSDGFGRIVTTDSMGLASVNFQPSAQTNFTMKQTQIQASASNLNSVVFSETIVPSTGSPAVYSTLTPGALLTGQSGSTLKSAVSISVISEQGQPIPNVIIQAIVPLTAMGQTGPFMTNQVLTPSPYVTCVDTTGTGVLTNTAGTAVCDLSIKAPAGTYSFSINVGSYIVQGPYTIKVTPGVPASVKIISGNNQTGAPGQALTAPFVVQVNDASGNPLVGQPVSFQVQTNGTLTLSAITNTDTAGRASAQGTLGTASGTYQVNVVAGSASNGPVATFSFTVMVPPSGIKVVSGNSQTGTVSTAFGTPLVVQVTNASGTGVAGVTVTFSASNGAALSTSSATTDSNGQAATTVTAGPAAGSITVTAAAAGGFTTSFSLTSVPAGPINPVFLNGASFQPGISPGSIAVIRAEGLLPGFTGLYTPNNIVGPLPTSVTDGSLAGLSVKFNGIAAPIFYASNQNGIQQIAVQVPYETSVGNATVVINTPGGGTGTFTVPILTVSPGIFETQYNGQSFAVAIRQSDGSYISPTNPAHVNDVVCVFATGLGQTTPALTTNNAGLGTETLANPIDVGLNNAGVQLVSAIPLAGQVGVFEVCMKVPQDTATGPRQPVGLIVHTNPGVASGDFYANGTYIPIQ